MTVDLYTFMIARHPGGQYHAVNVGCPSNNLLGSYSECQYIRTLCVSALGCILRVRSLGIFK